MSPQRISLVWRLKALQHWLSGQASADEARLIHRGRNLAVAWLPGRSARLVLVFFGIHRDALHPDRLEFFSIASDEGRNHVLFIADLAHSWYSMSGQRDQIAEVVRRFAARQGITTIWSIGNSMGGYGAILFCDRLPISKVIAFVPQILLSGAVPDHPTRYKNRKTITDRVERDLTPIMASADCTFHIVTGDKDLDDPIHLAHLKKLLPDADHVKIVIAPGQRHYVSKWLKKHGQLARLVAALWAGDRQELENCSRALPRPLDLSLA